MVQLPPSIRIGSSAVIELQTVEGAREYKSRIEDIENNMIHVAMPTEKGQLIVIPTGQYITLNVLTANAANLFVEGEIMGRRAQPFPVLILRPISVESNQQRNFHRIQVRIEPHAVWWWTGQEDPETVGAEPDLKTPITPATAQAVAPKDGEGEAEPGVWQRVRATIVDVSGGGVGLLADDNIPRNAIIQVRFPLPLTDEVLESRGIVMVARPRPQGPKVKYQLGVKFEGLNVPDQERLVKAIHQYQIEERRKARGL